MEVQPHQSTLHKKHVFLKLKVWFKSASINLIKFPFTISTNFRKGDCFGNLWAYSTGMFVFDIHLETCISLNWPRL